ncbi:MAG: insulinase family protein, partial [Alphaproteobacteria bacterium]|nr:insulinase family protein [Alphaproteobacteria bacterium]
MARSPIYKRRKNNLKYWLLLLLAGVLGYFVLSQIKSFTPQDLVENSELRGREFVTLVQEIVSPRHKIKAYLLEDKANPIVSMNFVFRNAGYVSDDENRQGLAKLVAALLKEGAGKYDRQEIKEMLAVNAIDIKFKAEKDDFSILMKTTKANLDKTIKLLSLMLFQPRFDEEDILRIKAKFYEEIKKQEEFPTKVVEQEFAREVFSNHPYERNSLGIKDNIKQISQKDLFTFVKNSFSKDNLLAGIAGDISSKETEKILDELFGQLPQKGKIKFVRNAEVDFTKASKK